MASRFCSNCLQVSLQTIMNFDDGAEVLRCNKCGTRFLLHRCGHEQPATTPNLLPLVLGAMSIVCPECRTLYNFGEAVAQADTGLGKSIMGLALLLFGVVALDKLTSKPKRKSKRR